jgi:hypothetical protein
MSEKKSGKTPFLLWPAVGVFMLMGGFAVYYGGRLAYVDAITLRARSELEKTGQFQPPETFAHVHQDLLRGLAILPDSPDLNEQMARLYANRGMAMRDLVPELARDNFREALKFYRAALPNRPMSPFTHANIALALSMLDEEPDAMWREWDLAMRWGPNEPLVQSILANVALFRYDQLDTARKQALMDVYARTNKRQQADLQKIAQDYGRDYEQLQPQQQ